jgi:CRISPR type III-A-associated RAMP protein Csm4
MNPGLVVKLRPAGPWRIGPDSGARNRVDTIYHSDTLYSAVTSALSRMGSLEEWLAATARHEAPAVSFSSCFPFLDEIGFIVPPRTVWPPNTPALMGAHVRWKSARFVPLGIVQALLAGKALDESQWSVDGPSECLVPLGRQGPFRTVVRWGAAVDRLTGSVERHSTACIEFREGAGLWTVVSFADDAARDQWREKVKAAFRLLADSGMGGERSRGWGRSETPEFLEGVLPDMILGKRAEPVPEPAAELPGGESVPADVEATSESDAEAEVRAPADLEPLRELVETESAAAADAEAAAVDAVVSEEAAESAPVAEPVLAVESTPVESAPASDAVGSPDEGAVAANTELEQPAEPVAAVESTPVESTPASDAVEAPDEGSAAANTELEQPAEPVTAAESAPVESAPYGDAVEAPHGGAAAANTELEQPAETGTAAESASVESAPAEDEAPVEPITPVEPATAQSSPPAVPDHLSAHWMLGLFSPAASDSVDWGRGNYTMLARGGRIESPSGSGESKKSVQMVAEGSVVYAAGAPHGSAPDVAPDGFPHPVFRAGFAVAIPLPEVR